MNQISDMVDATPVAIDPFPAIEEDAPHLTPAALQDKRLLATRRVIFA